MAHPATFQHPTISQPCGTADLCAVFKITPTTLRNWEKSGRIPPAIRIGRRKLWPADVISDLLNAQEGGAA